MTPNQLHAVATILGLAIWICIDPLEYKSNLISFLSRMSYCLDEHEKCFNFFYINSGSLQRPAAYSSQLITFCGGCFTCDAHDFKTCFWIKFLLMRRYITIEENLYEESYFIM